mmetsp:Transcript_11606/g.34495  ORF Transcript_11606/g.34495 Transcript_11606/m.34495 type:complete len:329 (-) Transcript_11606:428-1414(-)
MPETTKSLPKFHTRGIVRLQIHGKGSIINDSTPEYGASFVACACSSWTARASSSSDALGSGTPNMTSTVPFVLDHTSPRVDAVTGRHGTMRSEPAAIHSSRAPSSYCTLNRGGGSPSATSTTVHGRGTPASSRTSSASPRATSAGATSAPAHGSASPPSSMPGAAAPPYGAPASAGHGAGPPAAEADASPCASSMASCSCWSFSAWSLCRWSSWKQMPQSRQAGLQRWHSRTTSPALTSRPHRSHCPGSGICAGLSLWPPSSHRPHFHHEPSSSSGAWGSTVPIVFWKAWLHRMYVQYTAYVHTIKPASPAVTSPSCKTASSSKIAMT